MVSEDEKHILFIEPDRAASPSPIAVTDDLTRKVDYILSFAKPQEVHYLGWHETRCGKQSANYNFDLPNGFITNSLAPYYVQHYRLKIPAAEVIKINNLYQFITSSLQYPLVQEKSELETLRSIRNTKKDILLSDRIRFNEIVKNPTRPSSEVLLFIKELIDRNI